MKHPLETLLSAAGILLLALLSCLLLPAPSLGLTLAQKLVETFHMMDLNQLYTVLFCLWFLSRDLNGLKAWRAAFVGTAHTA